MATPSVALALSMAGGDAPPPPHIAQTAWHTPCVPPPRFPSVHALKSALPSLDTTTLRLLSPCVALQATNYMQAIKYTGELFIHKEKKEFAVCNRHDDDGNLDIDFPF